MANASRQKIKITVNEKINLLIPYVKKRIIEQIKSVAVIIIYLILFQTLVLGIPIAEASLIACGLAVVIVGLAFFMEGLFLGLMPLGETIGLKLPQKSKLPVILGFSFILGVGVTLAEPAIGVLKVAGSTVKAWEAPLLYLILNKYSNWLVNSVGLGVGAAVLFGMLRFIYNWSLKPFIYILVGFLSIVTVLISFNPNFIHLVGLAWDCGAVTTGPVTVPLVLALGIGICRILGGGSSDSAGFGVVTLASLFPIIAVILLGFALIGKVPQPMKEKDFFNKEQISKALNLFNNQEELEGYLLQNASYESQISYFGSEENLKNYIEKLKADKSLQIKIFGGAENALEKWAINSPILAHKQVVFGDDDKIQEALAKFGTKSDMLDYADLFKRNGIASVQAIVPLTIFLLLVLFLILRERLNNADEVMLGILFGVIGMFLFNIGIELGLSKLGGQVGSKLPSSFKKIELTEEQKKISNFDKSILQKSVTLSGAQEIFFIIKEKDEYKTIPFDEKFYNQNTNQYIYTPTKGPLFGAEDGLLGKLVVILFAFIMGYGATLAEPALNALGVTVEEITVGAFKKSLLMQSVALGVGAGIAIGVMKIIWNIPLFWMLVPPYILLLFVSKISTEEYVNIGWDSAGVTTGPITVPLVLAMGLGISGQVGGVEGFGILSMASVCPILSVLLTGLYVSYKRKKQFEQLEQKN